MSNLIMVLRVIADLLTVVGDLYLEILLHKLYAQ